MVGFERRSGRVAISWRGLGLLSLALVILSLGPPAAAQPLVQISGTVVDGNGAALPGVVVGVERAEGGGVVASVVTGVYGEFQVTVPAGRYHLRASLGGLVSELENLEVTVGRAQRVELRFSELGGSRPGAPEPGSPDPADPPDPIDPTVPIDPTGPPGTQKDGYFETHVYFATDRAVERRGAVSLAGRRDPAGTLRYGRVRVSIPDKRKRGVIQTPGVLRWFNRDDPTDFVLVLGTELFGGKDAFARVVAGLLTQAGRDDVLVFVHGYKNSFGDAAKRTAQLAYDLDFTGAPIFYSWPSGGGGADYSADEASVRWSRPHFEEFLRSVLVDLGAKNVHVIAHSMGNRLLTEALERIDLTDLPPHAARLRHIVLASPDVDLGIFQQLAQAFPGKAERITLYVNKKDKPLGLSRGLHQNLRAGNTVRFVRGVDTVDASSVETDFFAHSFFGNSILSDIQDLIRFNRPPHERSRLSRGKDEAVGGPYWVIDLP